MTEHRRLTSVVDGAPSELAIVVARGAGSFGVAVLHAGECVAFLTPEQAEADAAELRRMAKIARNPGKCPCEIGA